MEMLQVLKLAGEGVQTVRELVSGRLRWSAVARSAARNAGTLVDAGRLGNVDVMVSLAAPAVRGFLRQQGKAPHHAGVPTAYLAHFNWDYHHDEPELARLYAAAKRSQWDAADLPWDTAVDPHDDRRELVSDQLLPLRHIRTYRDLPRRAQEEQRQAFLAWILSQFLHGEQGALFAACQVTESVGWMDGKLYGSTQVMDEGRHVEVFHRYLTDKLRRTYPINDNLYVLMDAIMSHSAWDLKFLGMQIMIEGLALGAFSTLRGATREPLLRELLRSVITDEARHVHFGVVALSNFYARQQDDALLRERQDWAFEMCLLLRNRFLGHEFYDEFYAHCMTQKEWERLVLESDLMGSFRRTMFKRIIPNLKRIHLLPDRLRPHYAALGLLEHEHGAAAPELAASDLLDG